MDLPFAVDSPERITPGGGSLHHSNASSLVTASSQGSLLPADSPQHSGIIYSNNPQNYDNHHPAYPSHAAPTIVSEPSPENADFTFVTVSETDADEVDVVVEGRDPAADQDFPRGDVLAVLLSGDTLQNGDGSIVTQCEQANGAAHRAAESKQRGELGVALNLHAEAAKKFREAATNVREKDASLFHSLLLLSQTHAKSALALKRFLRQHPEGLQRSERVPCEGRAGSNKELSQQDRLRETVRGALSSKNEADISDSMFLGKASSSSGPPAQPQSSTNSSRSEPSQSISSPQRTTESVDSNGPQNPVDEMMELERELRDMDMALEMGNSIMSLGARTQSRLKQSTMEDGSFCVVPPGQSSYTSSSLWASGIANSPRHGTAGAGTAGQRARANRVQNILEASSATAPGVRAPPVTIVAPAPPQQQKSPPPSGLESSWWGNQSTASQMLASSFVHMGSSRMGNHLGGAENQGGQPANTKQLMRMLDSIKTLGDENAALLREVEGAEAARNEAKAAREQMRRFKAEYGKRFESLKSALEKFRKGYPEESGGKQNPVTNSNFLQSASTSDQIQRQEQLIRKLTADLKKEKEESKKKDAALRKYESFYREVKARSAQKAAQRQKEAQQRQRSKINSSRVPR